MLVATAETGAYGDNGEHGASPGVPKQDVDEGDDLQRLAKAHAVGQNTAKAAALAEALQRLNQVVVQEADPTDLATKRQGKRWPPGPEVKG